MTYTYYRYHQNLQGLRAFVADAASEDVDVEMIGMPDRDCFEVVLRGTQSAIAYIVAEDSGETQERIHRELDGL